MGDLQPEYPHIWPYQWIRNTRVLPSELQQRYLRKILMVLHCWVIDKGPPESTRIKQLKKTLLGERNSCGGLFIMTGIHFAKEAEIRLLIYAGALKMFMSYGTLLKPKITRSSKNGIEVCLQLAMGCILSKDQIKWIQKRRQQHLYAAAQSNYPPSIYPDKEFYC